MTRAALALLLLACSTAAAREGWPEAPCTVTNPKTIQSLCDLRCAYRGITPVCPAAQVKSSAPGHARPSL